MRQRHRLLIGCFVSILLVATASMAAELPKFFRLEPVLDDLTEPSSMARTPDGRILITERTTGNVRVVKLGDLSATPYCTVSVNASGDGGLLGIAVHPDFEETGWIYLYYTAAATNKNRVSRFEVDSTSCFNELPILPDLGAGASFLNNGGGLAFGDDDMLYVATGDMQDAASAQLASSLQGKILRVDEDGNAPGDNPIPFDPVYARGVRDGSGVSFNPAGQPYMSDRGDSGTGVPDEMNFVPFNGDLEWPGSTGTVPIVSWDPAVGLNSMTVYASAAYPDLDNDGIDNDFDRYGPNLLAGKARQDDNGLGECVGSTNNMGACVTNADCPPRPSEAAYCEKRDDPAEWCPSGLPIGDDDCDGLDEPEESYMSNLFGAFDGGIQRAVVNPPGLTTLFEWQTFLDGAALPDCPTGWTATMTGDEGYLYALATNGGGSGGSLYRIVYDDEPGPREVSEPESHFPLRVEKTANDGQVEVYWEDLRDDAKQPRDNGIDPLPPVREYTVWKGTLGGNFDNHVDVLDAIEGSEVNGAMRKATVDSDPETDEYFLVSARSANYNGELGKDSAGVERQGFATSDICGFGVPYHASPTWNLWACGQDFTLVNQENETRSLYDMRGRVVVIDLSAEWCGPCQSEADILELLYDEYKDRDVEVLTVLMDEFINGINWNGVPNPIECRNWGERPNPHTFDCWADPAQCPATPDTTCPGGGAKEAWPKYDAHNALPTNVVIDTGMRVIYTDGGYSSGTISNKLDALVGTEDKCLH